MGFAITAMLVVWVASLVFAANASPAIPGLVAAGKVQMVIPSTDFLKPAAKLTVEKVFQDDRRVGFFRVKLLTVLVAQGVRFELYQSALNTNWQAGFHFKPGLVSKGSNTEWRDVSVSVAPETTPRLHIQRLEPPAAAHPQACLLEGVTMQTAAGEIKAARAKWVLSGGLGWVAFESGGKSARWDLFAGNIVSDQPDNASIKQEENQL
jgi:hypothetical protein